MTVYRRPPARVMLEMAPRLASWDRVGAPGQLALAKFLDYADGVAAPLLVGDGPFALELSVAAGGWAASDRGGRDLDNYLFPLVNRLGPQRFAAVFGRKTQGSSWLAAGPALYAPTPVPSLFAVRMTGSYDRSVWKERLRARLIDKPVARAPDGPLALRVTIDTGPGRNWTNLWKPLIDSLGPILGEEDPGRPFHPRDDRIVDLGLHHDIDPILGHDVRIGLWWGPVASVEPQGRWG